MKFEIIKYKEIYKDEWNHFIENSKNGTFLFKREFMEYHKDRFKDYSLMLYVEDKLALVLPANADHKGTIISHAGLTYGGFVVDRNASVNKVYSYIYLVVKWLFEQRIESIKIKYLPDFFSSYSQSEIEHAFFLLKAKVYRIDTAFAYNYADEFIRKMPKGRKSEIKKAEKFNVTVEEDLSFDHFWNHILTPNLQRRFNVNPVHSLEEISLLKKNNFNNMKQFNAIVNAKIVAGATIFETKTTAHVQYLAGNDEARNSGALDYLFYYLIKYYADSMKYFDFGIVNENEGKNINFGMMKWKESFGTRVYLHKFFEIETKNYNLLNTENYLL